MIDLSTSYMGLELKHPVVASASPLSMSLDGIKRMEDANAAAIVMYSLYEEQIVGESHLLDHYLTYGVNSFAEALDYFPEMDSFNVGPEAYLNLIRRAKESVDIPIIGSLNGMSPGGWTEYASRIEEAGADGLELNIYYIPTDPLLSSADVEEMYLEVLREVRAAVSIPLAVKVGPFFSSFANMALRMSDAGANGLVVFNRFFQPDFDLERLEVAPNLELSRAYDMRLPLRWVAILYGRVPVDFALTRGVAGAEGVIKAIMAGAKVAMMASEMLRHGVERMGEVVDEVEAWMVEREYESVTQMRGSMCQLNVAEPSAFERANYMKVLQSWRHDPTGRLVR